MKKKILSLLAASAMLVGSMIITPVKAESIKPFLMNDIHYSTLKEAVDTASTRGTHTIQLTSDVELASNDNAIIESKKKIVLDLNGYTVTASNGLTNRWITNAVGGNLKVIGNGIIDFKDTPNVYGPIDNYGTLEVNDLTYIGTTESNSTGIWNRANGTATFNNVKMSGTATAIQTAEGSTTYINSGEYDSPWYAVVDNAGTMTINGGTFTNTSCSSCDNTHWGYTLRNKINGNLTFNNGTVYGVQGALAIVGGTATVEGGHFETRACQNHLTGYTTFYPLYVAGETNPVSATINGGEFISCYRTAALVGNDADGGDRLQAECTINNGYFETKGEAPVISGTLTQGLPFVTGGTFNKKVSVEYLCDNCTQTKNADGNYVVTNNN